MQISNLDGIPPGSYMFKVNNRIENVEQVMK